mmetsp:Transcript_9398/g.12180  ORF Transcript_9398/g.12180 Transcript_9398/m.12180 type:complete len:795 (+) Transcript_9398:1042-3426(+)
MPNCRCRCRCRLSLFVVVVTAAAAAANAANGSSLIAVGMMHQDSHSSVTFQHPLQHSHRDYYSNTYRASYDTFTSGAVDGLSIVVKKEDVQQGDSQCDNAKMEASIEDVPSKPVKQEQNLQRDSQDHDTNKSNVVEASNEHLPSNAVNVSTVIKKEDVLQCEQDNGVNEGNEMKASNLLLSKTVLATNIVKKEEMLLHDDEDRGVNCNEMGANFVERPNNVSTIIKKEDIQQRDNQCDNTTQSNEIEDIVKKEEMLLHDKQNHDVVEASNECLQSKSANVSTVIKKEEALQNDNQHHGANESNEDKASNEQLPNKALNNSNIVKIEELPVYNDESRHANKSNDAGARDEKLPRKSVNGSNIVKKEEYDHNINECNEVKASIENLPSKNVNGSNNVKKAELLRHNNQDHHGNESIAVDTTNEKVPCKIVNVSNIVKKEEGPLYDKNYYTGNKNEAKASDEKLPKKVVNMPSIIKKEEPLYQDYNTNKSNSEKGSEVKLPNKVVNDPNKINKGETLCHDSRGYQESLNDQVNARYEKLTSKVGNGASIMKEEGIPSTDSLMNIQKKTNALDPENSGRPLVLIQEKGHEKASTNDKKRPAMALSGDEKRSKHETDRNKVKKKSPNTESGKSIKSSKVKREKKEVPATWKKEDLLPLTDLNILSLCESVEVNPTFRTRPRIKLLLQRFNAAAKVGVGPELFAKRLTAVLGYDKSNPRIRLEILQAYKLFQKDLKRAEREAKNLDNERVDTKHVLSLDEKSAGTILNAVTCSSSEMKSVPILDCTGSKVKEILKSEVKQ